jgi:hypothetical protein
VGDAIVRDGHCASGGVRRLGATPQAPRSKAGTIAADVARRVACPDAPFLGMRLGSWNRRARGFLRLYLRHGLWLPLRAVQRLLTRQSRLLRRQVRLQRLRGLLWRLELLLRRMWCRQLWLLSRQSQLLRCQARLHRLRGLLGRLGVLSR